MLKKKVVKFLMCSVLSNLLMVGTYVSAADDAVGLAKFERDYVRVASDRGLSPFVRTSLDRLDEKKTFGRSRYILLIPELGYKGFCRGLGEKRLDIYASYESLGNLNWYNCKNNGVDEVIRLKIGYEAVVWAADKALEMQGLAKRDMHRLVVQEVQSLTKSEGSLEYNFYENWNKLNAKLPNLAIELYGPLLQSTTGRSMRKLGMEVGCDDVDYIYDMKYSQKRRALYSAFCFNVRQDAVYKKVSDSTIAKKLSENKKAVGIMSFSRWNKDKDSYGLQALAVDGVLPTAETIKSESYVYSRPFYLYIKKAHLLASKSTAAFVDEVLSAEAMGPNGYFAGMDLVALSSEEYQQVKKQVKDMVTMPVPTYEELELAE